MEYNWYVHLLKQRLNSLEKLKKKASASQKVKIDDAISTILDLVNDKQNYYNNYLNPESIIEDDYKYLEKLRFLWPVINGFSKSYDEMFIPDDTRLKLNDKDLLELLNLFFKNATNKKIYEVFSKFFNTKNIHFLKSGPDDFYADTAYIPYFDDIYIQMLKSDDFLDVITLAHEFGHGIHFLTNTNSHLLTSTNPFIEIVSTFFELICGDYFTKEGSFKKEAKATTYIEWEDIKMAACDLKRELALISEIEIESFESKNKLRDNIKKLLDNYDSEELDLILENNSANNFRYIIGYSIAIELFVIYKKDPDYAFYILNKLMILDVRLSEKEYYNRIQSLGIIPNENSDKYEEHIKRLILH